MKGTLQVVAALLLLNVAALALWSRAAPPPAARPTRVAVFNLAHVGKKYEKFKAYQIEVKKKLDPFQKRDAEKTKRAEKLAEEAKDVNLTADQRTQLEKKLTKLRREIEDNKAEAEAILVKSQERQVVVLYGEIEAVALRLANQRGYDLVMHYTDVDKPDRKSAENIARKMQAGALMPIYIEPSIDLTDAILNELHKDMKRESR